MTKLVIIRGIPGSGKTTLALTEYPNHILCEADQYFETENGYVFDGSKIKDAHEFCYNKVCENLKIGNDVVVANTFTRIWEMQKYFDLPYPVEVIEATGEYKNVHGVPDDVVERMKERFEKI